MTLAYVGGLVASVEAFGGGASIVKIGAVYMAAAAIAAASPTPGGSGAIEAALAAGLTGIGISSGAAVAAVLVTGWLPTGYPSCQAGSRCVCSSAWATYNSGPAARCSGSGARRSRRRPVS